MGGTGSGSQNEEKKGEEIGITEQGELSHMEIQVGSKTFFYL